MVLSPYFSAQNDRGDSAHFSAAINVFLLKNVFNNAAALPLPNTRKICATKPILRLIFVSSGEIIRKPSSGRHALQVQYQLCVYPVTAASAPTRVSSASITCS
jgi:hypothetical protein